MSEDTTPQLSPIKLCEEKYPETTAELKSFVESN